MTEHDIPQPIPGGRQNQTRPVPETAEAAAATEDSMNAQTKPFPNADLADLFAPFKAVPGFDAEALWAQNKKTLETYAGASQIVAEGLQAAGKRQMEALQGHFEAGIEQSRKLAEAGTGEERLAIQADHVKAVAETAVAESREMGEMIAKSLTEAAEMLHRRFADGMEEWKAMAAR